MHFVLQMLLFSSLLIPRCIQPTNITERYEVSYFKIGEPLELSCRITNLTGHRLMWLKDGVDLTQQSTRVNLCYHNKNYNMSIEKTLPDDVGLYTCVLLEGTKSQGIIEVLALTELVVEVPEIQVGIEDRPLTILCNVTGRPSPKIHWRHDYNNQSITIYRSQGRYKLSAFEGLKNAVITVQSLISKDTGNVTCIARVNYHPRIKEGRCNLIVKNLDFPWAIFGVLLSLVLPFLVLSFWCLKGKGHSEPSKVYSPKSKDITNISEGTSSSEEEFIRNNQEKLAMIAKINGKRRSRRIPNWKLPYNQPSRHVVI